MNLSLSIFSRPVVFLLAAAFCYSCTACDLLGIGSNDNDRDPAFPDTTSSQFTWRVDTVGFINTFLRDVAIIDSNNIWVVGEIPERDFGGANDYNAMRWDGEQWNPLKIPSDVSTGPAPNAVSMTDIGVFPSGAIWAFNRVGGYGEFIDGRWETGYVLNRRGSVTDIVIAGNDSSFLIGTNGSLTFRENSGFSLIGTQTNLDLDFGHFANDTLKFGGVDTLLQYIDGVLQPEFEPEAAGAFRLSGGFTDVWHSGTHWWYSTGSGLYRFEPDSGYVQLSQRGISFLTGNSSQDVFTTDRVRFGYHWNGRTVTSFDLDALVPEGIAFINGIDMKENLLVITGWTEGLRGFILTGKRNPN